MLGFISLQKYHSYEEMEKDPFPLGSTSVAEFHKLLRKKTVQNVAVKGGEKLRFLDEVTLHFTDQSSVTFKFVDSVNATVNFVQAAAKPRRIS